MIQWSRPIIDKEGLYRTLDGAEVRILAVDQRYSVGWMHDDLCAWDSESGKMLLPDFWESHITGKAEDEAHEREVGNA